MGGEREEKEQYNMTAAMVKGYLSGDSEEVGHGWMYGSLKL